MGKFLPREIFVTACTSHYNLWLTAKVIAQFSLSLRAKRSNLLHPSLRLRSLFRAGPKIASANLVSLATTRRNLAPHNDIVWLFLQDTIIKLSKVKFSYLWR